jgi:drug/metabolite transporter (DMT)-like permease
MIVFGSIAFERGCDSAYLRGVPIAFIVVWSSGFIAAKYGVDAAPPLGLLTLRFVLAVPVAVLLALRVPGWREAPLARLALVGVLLQGVQFGAAYSGLALGVHPALGSLIMLGLAPVVTTALSSWSGAERVGARTWALLAAGVLGVTVSLLPTLGEAHAGPAIALVVLGMLGLAGGTVLQKRWVGAADPRVSVATQLVAGCFVLAPIAFVSGQLSLEPSRELFLSAAWLAWPLSIGGMWLLIALLRRHDASIVGALLLAVPAVTAVMSLVILGDAIAPVSAVGLAVATAAVVKLVRPAPRERSADRRWRSRAALSRRTSYTPGPR